MTTRTSNRIRRSHGYTLVEMLVALIMFLFITVATSFALSAALRAQQAAQQKIDESQELRSLVGIISRDVRAAYASEANPNTFFLATSDGSGTSSLSFTTLTHRIQLTQPGQDPNNPVVTDESQTVPQSDVAVVTYTFDPSSGTLSRTESAVPNPDVQPQPGTPQSTLSSRVRALQVTFLDPANPDPDNGWRDSWSYISQAAQTSGSDLTQMVDTSGQQDTTLPMTVRISLVLASPNGMPTTYTTTMPVLNPQPQAKGQAPDAPITAGASGSGSGGPGSGGSGGGSGGAGGGATGGGAGAPGGTGGTGNKTALPGLSGIGPRP